MADKFSDLVPEPYANKSYCRIKEGKLIVVVKNQGEEAADSDTWTKVTWGQDGVFGEEEKPTKTKGLKKGDQPIEVEFDCPEECFVPDCIFKITVDSRKELGNEGPNDWNNEKKGTCFKDDQPYLPDLVPEPYKETNTYWKRKGNTLIVQIKNQGTAIAGESTTEVKFENGDKETKKTDELTPGESIEISVPIPGAHHKGNFRFKISADVGDKVRESKDDNNVVIDTYIEPLTPL